MFSHWHLAFLVAALLLPPSVVAQPAVSAPSAPYLRAIYRLDYKLDSAVATPKRDQMILRVHDGTSCFQSLHKFKSDSLFESLRHLPPQEQFNRAGPILSRFKPSEHHYSIFKQPSLNLVSYHDNIGTVDHQYQEKAPVFRWRLTPERRTVAGYACQQAYAAFGGRVWEAWFTRDIPISDGPYKFFGLPGLIVQVRDTHGHYVFELLSFEGSARPFTIYADTWAAPKATAPLVKKRQFVQAKHHDDLTIIDRLAASGNVILPGMRQNHFAMLKRRNNPLELE